MIRTIFVLLYIVVFSLISLPMYLAERIVRASSPERSVRLSYSYISWGFRCVKAISGTRLTVIGKENVPADQAVLYICNHRSFFDTVLMFPLMNNPTSIMAKKEMEKVPVISRWMRLVNCQFLDRDDIRQGLKCILNSIALVKGGESVCIFPEGTRSKTNEMGEFKEGSFKVAQKSGCLIVPVAISNTDNILEKHFPAIKAQPAVIEFGQPVDIKTLSEDDRKHLGNYVRDIVAVMLEKDRSLYE